MKKELLEILEYEYRDSLGKEIIMRSSERLINFYESQRSQATVNFRQTFVKYRFENIPSFSLIEENPIIELFHGSGGLKFWPLICTDDGVLERNEADQVIVEEPLFEVAGRLQSDQERAYEDQLYYDIWEIHRSIVFTWLSTIWQNIRGYEYGMIVRTCENNSVSTFTFNDLAWNELSEYKNYSNSLRIFRHFGRELSIFEIYKRVNFDVYPINPYKNSWREFKKLDQHYIIGKWGNEVCEQTSGMEKTISNKITLEKRLKYEKKQSDLMINEGYEEIHCSYKDEQIHNGAINLSFYSGIHWYYDELKNRLSDKEVKSIETQLGVELPFYFKQYLKLFNGRKYNKYYMNFNISETETISIKSFYNKDELIKENTPRNGWLKRLISGNEEVKWLKIGVTTKSYILCLDVGRGNNNGLLKLESEEEIEHEISYNFETFINKAKH